MTDTLLVRHCAPTLAGLKTGALFSCLFSDHNTALSTLSHWNQRLSPKGLHLIPLAQRRGRTLVYIYRATSLTRDLRCKAICSILLPLGYPCPNPERCIVHLMKKLRSRQDFPHELGLFLGYPPEDVLGYINDSTNCRFSGCWKVYGDVTAAQATFQIFRTCTQLACRQLALGATLESVTTAG